MVPRFAEWTTIPNKKGELKAEVVLRSKSQETSVRCPVAGISQSNRIAVAAVQKGSHDDTCLLTFCDDLSGWTEAAALDTCTTLPCLSLGALSAVSSGRWILAGCAYKQVEGVIERAGKDENGLNVYRWEGFNVQREPFILLSRNLCNWSCARIETYPFLTAAPCGRIIEQGSRLLLPVYGPTSLEQKDRMLSDIGLLVSTNGGVTWSFDSFIVRADTETDVAWGASDFISLPDGRWLAMLAGYNRRHGAFTRPSICRSLSNNARSWSEPEPQLLGPVPTVASLGGSRIMVGTWYEAGMTYNISSDLGNSWEYQGFAWDCIWYAEFSRGGFKLVKLDEETILGVFHWCSATDISVSEIKSVILGRSRL